MLWQKLPAARSPPNVPGGFTSKKSLQFCVFVPVYTFPFLSVSSSEKQRWSFVKKCLLKMSFVTCVSRKVTSSDLLQLCKYLRSCPYSKGESSCKKGGRESGCCLHNVYDCSTVPSLTNSQFYIIFICSHLFLNFDQWILKCELNNYCSFLRFPLPLFSLSTLQTLFLSTLHDIERSPFIFQLMESTVLHLLFMLRTEENIQ